MINSKEDFVNFYRKHNDNKKWELIEDAITSNEGYLCSPNNIEWKDFLDRNKFKYKERNSSWLLIPFEENLI